LTNLEIGVYLYQDKEIEMKLTKAQQTTLNTIARNGGEMNGFAGQKGFYTLSVSVLSRLGLIEELGSCDCRRNEDGKHTVNHTILVGQKHGESFYNRVRITELGCKNVTV
jgi:hypothetical protein